MGVSKKWHIGRSRAKAFLDEAYALESEAEAIAFYDRWAEEYDAQVERGLRYVAPRELAETLSRYHAPCDVPVLDVGCGTGLTGSCLRELGFSTIDGLDLSTAMLEKAREKGVYRSLMAADLNAPLALDDGAYGAVVCSGTFTQGHVGPGPIDEPLTSCCGCSGQAVSLRARCMGRCGRPWGSRRSFPSYWKRGRCSRWSSV
jgi:SAM-dependent methyltransferase